MYEYVLVSLLALVEDKWEYPKKFLWSNKHEIRSDPISADPIRPFPRALAADNIICIYDLYVHIYNCV